MMHLKFCAILQISSRGGEISSKEAILFCKELKGGHFYCRVLLNRVVRARGSNLPFSFCEGLAEQITDKDL